MPRAALIFFFKYPELGNVKTRLARDTGNNFAFELYCNFLRDIFSTCKSIDAETVISCSITGELPDNGFFWDSDLKVIFQNGRDIGERMLNSFKSVFKMDFESSVLIGSDSPDLSDNILNDAFRCLESDDIVLGPSNDGGYYLIGFKKNKLDSSIFADVQWSTDNVLEKTLENIKSKKMNYSLLPYWNDIDELGDLIYFFDNNKNREIKTCTMKYLLKNIEILEKNKK